MRTLKTSNHDVAGNSFLRVVRLAFLNKILPLGNFGGGTGMRPALVLLLLHLAGRPLFYVLIRFEGRLHRMYQRLKKRG